MLDDFSVKFLYAKIHLITKFILVILSFLLYYYIFSTYVSPVNIDYCCQGSVACIFVYLRFLYNIVIIEKKIYFMATKGTIRARDSLTVDEVIERVFADDDSEQFFFLNQTVIVRRVSLLKIHQPKK